MTQIHLTDQQISCVLRCILYKRFDSILQNISNRHKNNHCNIIFHTAILHISLFYWHRSITRKHNQNIVFDNEIQHNVMLDRPRNISLIILKSSEIRWNQVCFGYHLTITKFGQYFISIKQQYFWFRDKITIGCWTCWIQALYLDHFTGIFLFKIHIWWNCHFIEGQFLVGSRSLQIFIHSMIAQLLCYEQKICSKKLEQFG